MQTLKSSRVHPAPVSEILIGLGFLVYAWINSTWLMAIVGVGLIAVALGSFAIHAVSRARVGAPELSISTKTLRAGEELSLSYDHTFNRDADIEGVVFRLIMRETVRYWRGTEHVTVSHDKVVWNLETPGRHVTAGEVISDRHTLRIPPDAMHTFTPSDDNRIEWIIKFRARVRRWPDYSEEHRLTVLPERVG